MRATLRQYVRSCLVCAKNKPSGTRKNHLMISQKTGHRFGMIRMDLVGPLLTTEQGKKYIHTITNYWTRWCEAVPIPNKEAPMVWGHGLPDMVVHLL